MAHSIVLVLSTAQIIANILGDKPISVEELDRISLLYPSMNGEDVHQTNASSDRTARTIYIYGESRELLRKQAR